MLSRRARPSLSGMQPRPPTATAAKEAALGWALARSPEEVTRPQGSPWFAGPGNRNFGLLASGSSQSFPGTDQEEQQGWQKPGNSLELTLCGLVLKSTTSATWERKTWQETVAGCGVWGARGRRFLFGKRGSGTDSLEGRVLAGGGPGKAESRAPQPPHH